MTGDSRDGAAGVVRGDATVCGCGRPIHFAAEGEMWEHPDGEKSSPQWLHAGYPDDHDAVPA